MDKFIKAAFAGAVTLGGLYALSTQGRTGHKGLPELKKWKYAHRGFHNETRPENSMAAFRAALDQGYGIELDIHLIKDGNLAVMHDCDLKRTTGCEGKITDLTTEQLKDYHLGGTEETIPTFREILDLFAGKAPLIIELKADDNASQLVEAAVKAMEGYEGPWCMESFDPRCVYALKKHHPEVIRGQLTENYFKSPNCKLPTYLKWALTHQVLNFMTAPDFVAYNCRDLDTISNKLVRKYWGVAGVTWTLRTKEDYDAAVADGWIPIFENFEP
ncbi:MAG: glycerophosphodiester phosphodiesterase [Oscillospiraceae bacterium]|nr:glycerophosphodiester phosphodiesterase [Oscillospiraceae bacterium]